MTSAARIPFAELRPGRDRGDVAQAIDRVLARGWFVLGPEVEAFEAEFAAASGAAHAVGVASGTDAIALALRALDIGPGDEVIVPAMTAAFTGLAVASIGAAPVIVDVDPRTLAMDAGACAAAVSPRTRAVVPVHLYGQPADLDGLLALASRHGLAVVEDCCQAHLATNGGVPVGTAGAAGAFSFYPTKNLGALGDGGAVVTNDAALADRVRRLRNGGQAGRYQHVEPGVNSRLDELQAAVLRVRLPGLAEATAVRRDLARTYRQRLGAGRDADRRARSRARLPPVSRPLTRTGYADGVPGRARHRDAGALPRAALVPAGIRAIRSARVPGRGACGGGAAVAAPQPQVVQGGRDARGRHGERILGKAR